MRIYEGAPRQNYSEVLRSIGAVLDQRGLREITLNETDDGFIVQGLAVMPDEERPWNDPAAQVRKETFVLHEDDIARFMEEAIGRRQERRGNRPAIPSGYYELALRVLGSYVDQQGPRDVFFFEQGGQFVVRLLMNTREGLRHMLVEFTREEIDAMISVAQRGRGR